MALSVRQNGKIPKFLSKEYLEELFGSEKHSHECTDKLRSGFQNVGIYQIVNAIPTLFTYFFCISSINGVEVKTDLTACTSIFRRRIKCL